MLDERKVDGGVIIGYLEADDKPSDVADKCVDEKPKRTTGKKKKTTD